MIGVRNALCQPSSLLKLYTVFFRFLVLRSILAITCFGTLARPRHRRPPQNLLSPPSLFPFFPFLLRPSQHARTYRGTDLRLRYVASECWCQSTIIPSWKEKSSPADDSNCDPILLFPYSKEIFVRIDDRRICNTV